MWQWLKRFPREFVSFILTLARAPFGPLLLLAPIPPVMLSRLDAMSSKVGGLTPADRQGLLAATFLITAGVLAIAVYARGREARRVDILAEAAAQRASEHPERPELAWEAGRAMLTKYVERNLAQVRTIATLTYFVLLAGFGFIGYGLFQAFADPTKLPVSVVSAASGVIVSFVGGSFMLIYRSLLGQSKEYLFVVERLNGVGMAVSILEGLPDDQGALRSTATADLAKTLLTLYGAQR